jgi:hypothetical protein
MSFSGEEGKSLSAWRLELKKYGKRHWLKFYEELMGSAVSRFSVFYKALQNYGEWAMFDAILAASTQPLEGDPLNYVVKIAQNKWKEEQLSQDQDTETEQKIQRAIEETRKRNEELEKKLRL